MSAIDAVGISAPCRSRFLNSMFYLNLDVANARGFLKASGAPNAEHGHTDGRHARKD